MCMQLLMGKFIPLPYWAALHYLDEQLCQFTAVERTAFDVEHFPCLPAWDAQNYSFSNVLFMLKYEQATECKKVP